MVIHAGGGITEVRIDTDRIIIEFIDKGPGINVVGLAMTEGWLTANDKARRL